MFAVDEELLQLGAFGGDDRRAARHGLEIDLSERFTDRRVDEVVGAGIGTGQLFAAEIAEEAHAILGKQRLERLPVGPVADNTEKGLTRYAVEDEREELEVLLRRDSSHAEKQRDRVHLFFGVAVVRAEHAMTHGARASRGIEQFRVDARLPDDHGPRHARVLHEVGEVLADGQIDRRVDQVLQANELVDATSHLHGVRANVGGEIEVDVRVRRPNDGQIERPGQCTAEHGGRRLFDDVNDVGAKTTDGRVHLGLERG